MESKPFLNNFQLCHGAQKTAGLVKLRRGIAAYIRGLMWSVSIVEILVSSQPPE